jgi:broad specificity phosphatase PhoE
MIQDYAFSRRAVLLATAILGVTLATSSDAGESPQFWFVRHAESEINVESFSHTVPDEGVSYPLTRSGIDQALALADTLADVRVVGLYSSPRLRAIQTADAIAFRQRINVVLAPEAVEIDLGIAVDASDGRQSYRDLVRKWVVDRDVNARIGEGETLSEAQRRFLPFVRELMNRHMDDSGVVIVMSHGATLGVLLPILATNVPSDFALTHPLSNTSIIKTELRDGKLFCTEWAGLAQSEFAAPAPTAQQVKAR